jgi:hypothetical protein
MQVCAYANNQHQLGTELGGGVETSPFVRALSIAEGTLTIVDRAACVFTRMWCAYELYISVLSRGAAFAHDIFTARAGLADRNGKSVPAVGLLSGYGATDWGFAANKAAREAAFPDELIVAASAFELARASASQASDATAILTAVGADAPKVDATVRARFGLAKAGTLLSRARGIEREAAGASPTDEALEAVCTALRGSQLRSLALRCAPEEVSDAAVRSLVSALPRSVEVVNATGIGHGSVDLIAERVQSGQLTKLSLLECALTPAAAAALGAAAASSLARLHTLDLRESGVGDDGVVALAAGLRANRSLTTLNLEMNDVGDVGALALAELLRAGSSLESLDLFDNSVAEEGALALAGALEANRTLASLNLITNSIGRAAREQLEAAWVRTGRAPAQLQLVDGDSESEGAGGEEEEDQDQDGGEHSGSEEQSA